jgi:hypothetical protein
LDWVSAGQVRAVFRDLGGGIEAVVMSTMPPNGTTVTLQCLVLS